MVDHGAGFTPRAEDGGGRRYGTWRTARALADAEPDEWLVKVRYEVAGLPRGCELGRDVGTLSLVEGWLVFRGARTDWSLRRDQVGLTETWRGSIVSFSESPRNYHVCIDHGPSLRFLFENWMPWVAVGEAVWPPVRPTPEGWAGRGKPWGWPGGRLACVLNLVGLAAVPLLPFPVFPVLFMMLLLWTETASRRIAFEALGPPDAPPD